MEDALGGADNWVVVWQERGNLSTTNALNHTNLAITGINRRQMGIWETIGQHMTIQQKTVVHTPLEKLRDACINILAGVPGPRSLVHRGRN